MGKGYTSNLSVIIFEFVCSLTCFNCTDVHATCQTLDTLTTNLRSLFYLSYSRDPVLNLNVFVQTFIWKENSLFWSCGLFVCFHKVESFFCKLFLFWLITAPRPFAKSPYQSFSYPHITPFYSHTLTHLVVSSAYFIYFVVLLLRAVVMMELMFL